jgi:hypothetical protein
MGFPFCESFFPWLDERSALHRRNHRRPCLNFRAMMRSQHPYVSILCLMVSRGKAHRATNAMNHVCLCDFERAGSLGVYFCRATPARATDCLALCPPFPPAAERCALAVVLSMMERRQESFHQGAEQALPPSAHRPAMEPIVNRGRGPLNCRTILPATPRPQHMNDAANDAPVIHAAAPVNSLAAAAQSPATAARSAKFPSHDSSSTVRA